MPVRRLLIAALAAGLVLLPVAPAAAHPFGPPPTARVTANGNVVTIDWSATPDDAVAIGERLDLMPEGSVAQYRQEAAAQVAPSARDEARLSASPLLADYLREHVVVEQDGTACPTDIPPPPDFVHRGARIIASCPAEVDEVVLRITMLHEIHPAYRTVAVGEDSQSAQSVFTTAAPAATWRFGAAAAPAGVSPVLWAGAALSVIGFASAAVIWRRQARRA